MENVSAVYDSGAKKIDDMLKDSEGKVIGKSLVDVTSKLLDLSQRHGLFVRDVVTGLCKSCLSDSTNGIITPKVAKLLWITHFKDRIRIRPSGEDGLRRLSNQDLDILWENIFNFSTYNSRKEMFDAIPEWDGVPRIESFMADYFKCATNPNFFLLFLTAVVGKMDDPEKNYCPFFFDFVGQEKGTGKSSFCSHLIGKYAVMATATSRAEDFFVNAYDSNALILIDDENTTTSTSKPNHMTHDELKAFVTQKYDKFSRKFQQPEEHARAFVFVRTSNEAMNVWSPNERRQIIFKVGLPERVCLHWKLDQNYMNQLLAEAKDYYVKHDGIYQLTEDDWLDVEKQNRDNFNYETDDFESLLKFVTQLYDAPQANEKYFIKVCNDSGQWISWRGYNQWRKDNKEIHIDPRRFNRLMFLISKNCPDMISYSSDMQRVEGISTLVHAGKLKQKKPVVQPNINDIPDMEF